MNRLKALLMMCFLTLAAIAQAHVVSGIVLDIEGEPLAGASIIPDGGANPGVTDIDGKFSLNIPSNVKTLTVSYVGMLTATVNVTDSPMTIVLQNDDTSLDEVMVVAFGTAKKSAFTGSAAVVNSEELSKHVTTNVASALAGSVPGFIIRGASGTPGSQGSINIRGIGSMYAETNPLIILDGAPYEGNLNDLAQTDIASISVLKDAASAALYGARGATGVILITTKDGNNNKTRITFDAKWGANSRAVQEYDIIDSPAQYYETYYRQVQNWNNDLLTPLGMYTPEMIHQQSVDKTIKDLAYNVYSLPAGESLIGLDGRLNPNASLGNTFNYNGKDYYLTPDDWTDAAYRSGFRQEYNFAVNGGNERATFYTSLNYLDEDGVVDYSSFERVSGRIKADYKATDWLKLGANVNYTHSATNSTPNGSNVMYFTSMLAPIYPIYVRQVDGAGNISIATDRYGNPAYDYGNPNAEPGYGLMREFSNNNNPLGSNRYDKNRQTLNYMNASLKADVTFTPYLRLNVNSLVSWLGTDNSSYSNQFYGSSANTGGDLTKTHATSISTNNVQTLSFFKDFNGHYVNAMLGHEYYRTTSKNLSGSSYGGFSPDITELSAFATPYINISSTTNYNVEGWFLNLQYNYDERYFASASYRRDASSHFLKSHRWGNFWSIGGAWIINRETFMSQAKFIDLLKLKASIGQQGNDNIGTFAYYNMYNLTPAADGLSTIPTFSQLGNPDITWETTTNFNLGLEWELFGHRLNGQFEFYNKKTSDLLFFLSLPRSTGARGYYDNIGDIRNTGVELNLEGVIIRTRDYDWKVGINLAHNTTRILSLPESKTGKRGGFVEGNLWYAEGCPLYNYMTPVFAGLNENGQALYYQDTQLLNNGTMDTSRPGVNRDETTTDINLATRYAMGSTLPKVNGGFSTSARIKWFDIALSFDYQIGGKLFDQRYQFLMSPTGANSTIAGMNFHKDVLNSWSAENTNTDIPRWYYQDSNSAAGSDRFLTNASYLNFHSFTVGFNMPRKWVNNYADVRLYVSGENLCFWSKRKGFDPRAAYSGTTYTPTVSPVRTVMGGVQLSF